MPRPMRTLSRDLIDSEAIKARIEAFGTGHSSHRYIERISELFEHGEEVSEELAQQYNWNIDDVSKHARVLDHGLRFCGGNHWKYTDGVRGKKFFDEGIHCWEIFHTELPDSAVDTLQIGVGTKTAPLARPKNSEEPLIGWTSESWGWDIGSNLAHHSQDRYGGNMFPHFLSSAERIKAPTTIRVVLDMDLGTLAFSLLEDPTPQQYAIAFEGLEGRELYPMAAASEWTQANIKYIRRLTKDKAADVEKSTDQTEPKTGPSSSKQSESELKDEASGYEGPGTSGSSSLSKRKRSDQLETYEAGPLLKKDQSSGHGSPKLRALLSSSSSQSHSSPKK